MNLLTTQEAANQLGVSRRRVQAMITAGRIVAERKGRDFFIKQSELDKVKDRKRGRPPLSGVRRTSANKV
jgi:excisionase family DNA binding protein